jgi:predicted transcriptional regulator
VPVLPPWCIQLARGRAVVAELERQDITLPFWSLDQAAKHFGFARATIEKYVREGMPTYFAGRMVKPDEVITERLARRDRQQASRRPRSAQ